MLHGTLRSELDEPSQLLPAFEKLVTAITHAQADYDRGVLTRQALAERLAELTVVGPDGGEWTLGATTGQWYRRFNNGDWTSALPPEADEDGAVTPGVPAAHDPAPFDAVAAFLTAPAAETAGEGPPAEAPHPAVGRYASTEPLPAVGATEAVAVDDTGVWTSGWDASAIEGGYRDAPAGGADSGDTWGAGLDALFDDDEVPALLDAATGDRSHPAWGGDGEAELSDSDATPAGDAWEPAGWSIPAYDPDGGAAPDEDDDASATDGDDRSWIEGLGLPPELFEDPDQT